jgi:RNA-directed DNA polymerase
VETWSAHQLVQLAESLVGDDTAYRLAGYAKNLSRSGLPVIFTLRHLARITGVDYGVLRASVERKREVANYRLFAIKKRAGGRRHIHAVGKELSVVQHFLNTELLQKLTPHSASFAFHSSGGIRACAAAHCGARWLFQYDLDNFFYSINEADVHEIFTKAGYRPLLAFELARLCTTTRVPRHFGRMLRKESSKTYQLYQKGSMGVLPQGAPTSPMLSALAAYKLDIKLEEFADKYNLVYTRYADDITVSSAGELPRNLSIAEMHRAILGVIRKSGFEENDKKTRIARPGSRKVVLGLLVDGDRPRISKQTYKRIDRHIHACHKYGFAAVADHEGFDSPLGFYHHLKGLVAFVKDVDLKRWREFSGRLDEIPPIV